MKAAAGSFLKVNLFRLLLLLFMLTTGGSLFISIIQSWIENYKTFFRQQSGKSLIIILYAIWIPIILVPIIFTVYGIIAHRKDPWISISGSEITGRVFVTLFKMILYALGLILPVLPIVSVTGQLFPLLQ